MFGVSVTEKHIKNPVFILFENDQNICLDNMCTLICPPSPESLKVAWLLDLCEVLPGIDIIFDKPWTLRIIFTFSHTMTTFDAPEDKDF